MKNLKDNVTSICGLIIALCGAFTSLSAGGMVLPAWVITTCTILSAISTALIGYYTGKNPNGSVMNKDQIDYRNNLKKT